MEEFEEAYEDLASSDFKWRGRDYLQSRIFILHLANLVKKKRLIVRDENKHEIVMDLIKDFFNDSGD